eukprot:jgi/Mesen1/3943/ME000209S02957
MSACRVVGPTAAGLLASRFSPAAPGVVSGGLMLGAACLVYLASPQSGGGAAGKQVLSANARRDSFKDFVSDAGSIDRTNESSTTNLLSIPGSSLSVMEMKQL